MSPGTDKISRQHDKGRTMPIRCAIFVVYLSHPKLPSHSSEEWVTVCAKNASCKGIRILESGKFLFLLFGILGFFESGVQIKESRMPLSVIRRFPCTFEPCFSVRRILHGYVRKIICPNRITHCLLLSQMVGLLARSIQI